MILVPAEPLKCLDHLSSPLDFYNYHPITFKLGTVALLHNLTPIHRLPAILKNRLNKLLLGKVLNLGRAVGSGAFFLMRLLLLRAWLVSTRGAV